MKQAFWRVGPGIALGFATVGLAAGVAAAPAAASAEQIRHTISDGTDVWLDMSVRAEMWQNLSAPAEVWLDM